VILFREFDRGICNRAAARFRIGDIGSNKLQPAHQLGVRIGVLCLELLPHQILFAEQAAQVFGHQLILRREVPVERHLVGFGCFRDGVDADGANPVLIEKLGRRREDACARWYFLSDFSGLRHFPSNSSFSP
jgi:hypothetical protein